MYCENERGEKFIVELQKSKQNFFKDRTVYYSTFPIREQAKRADWDYELKAVYTIAKYTPDQVRSYEDSLKYYRDLKNSLDTAKEEGKMEGKIEGKMEGKIEVAKNLLKNGVSIDIIMKTTGLTEKEITDMD